MTVAIPNEFELRVKRNEPMSRHTSWHVGGPAEVYFNPRDREELASFMRQLPSDVSICWVGLGSNLLVRDGGLEGVVISTHGTLDRLERQSETMVLAEAGVPCALIARQCIKWGLGPAEFFAGIPGTMGGALAMNAGAFGGETWNHVVEVETMDRHGRHHTRSASEYRASYRHVEMPVADEWFLSAKLSFEHKPGANEAAVKEMLAKRKATQPIGEWSGGSTFTNPPQDHAARLVIRRMSDERLVDLELGKRYARELLHG